MLLYAVCCCSELNEAILNFAAGLKAHGLQQGDKVRHMTLVLSSVVW
jgi:hypothetical protein